MTQLIAAISPQGAVHAGLAGSARAVLEQVRHGARLGLRLGPWFDPRAGRWAALLAIAALALTSGSTARVVAEALSEAYLAVAVFVAGTLILLQGLELVLKEDLGSVMARLRGWQVPTAALLGAFPGCGGAIVVVTQYTRGTIGFGALVATLTATMGDAMFLLLAKEPATGLLVFVLGLVVGTLSGWVIDALGGRWIPAAPARPRSLGAACPVELERAPMGRGSGRLERVWLGLALPGLALGVLAAFRVETDTLFGPLAAYEPTLWLGIAGAVLSLVLWAERGNPEAADEPGSACGAGQGRLSRVAGDTSFITSWVVFAFLAFQLCVHFAALDLTALFQTWAPVVPLLAILVGWLPGCGPQIVVTSLYLAGSLPLSAQLGNAISNDGDALFPALALAPRAALMATLASTVPALLVGYGAFLLLE